MQIAAAFTGARVALLLADESGIWYRDSSGLSPEQMAALEGAVSRGLAADALERLAHEQGFRAIEALPLVDVYQRPIGTLWALFPSPLEPSERDREGLSLAAAQMSAILTTDRQRREMRNTPRAPSATSFVPGLVHELRNFIFGISANLDAFAARYADQGELARYGATIRLGLDRLRDFVEELREYADPKTLSWVERPLEPLLRDACAHLKPLSDRNRVTLNLHIEESLPPLCVDESSLLQAFIHLIGLLIQQEGPGGHVELHLTTQLHDARRVICGHLDGSSLKLENVDLARLFEPFYFRGSGFGRLALPAARRVFESHGGNLTAGPGPAGGMRIHFMLPAAIPYSLQSAGQP